MKPKYEMVRIVVMAVIAVIAVIAIIINGKEDGGSSEVVRNYRKTARQSDYILHALGGDGDKFYINSIDCLEKGYAAGFRLFEADVSFTSDGRLVLAHSGENNVWTKNDWELRFGQEYPFDENGAVSASVTDAEEYDVDKHLCSYDKFMSFSIQGEYKATSFDDLLDYMETHTDMYVMIDAGHRSYEDTKVYYDEIVRSADGRTDVLNRMIAGGQTTEMVRAAREAYDFPIINLYYDSDEKREEILSTPEKFVRYCKDNNIISYSVAKETYTDDVAKVLGKSKMTGYVFTVNDEKEAERFRKIGASAIGTDFLWTEK